MKGKLISMTLWQSSWSAPTSDTSDRSIKFKFVNPNLSFSNTCQSIHTLQSTAPLSTTQTAIYSSSYQKALVTPKHIYTTDDIMVIGRFL